jgi:hypothetical protein
MGMMRLSKSAASLALAGALCLCAAAEALAQSDAARTVSEDAAILFGELCVTTRGNAQQIDQTITKQRLQALPLSEDGVRDLLEGKPGDLGWIVRTDRGTGLQLHLTPTMCNMRAMDTDDAAVNQVLAALLEGLAVSENFKLEKVMDERRQTNGGEERLVGYRLTWQDVNWSANLGISHIAGDGQDIPPQVSITLALRQTT